MSAFSYNQQNKVYWSGLKKKDGESGDIDTFYLLDGDDNPIVDGDDNNITVGVI